MRGLGTFCFCLDQKYHENIFLFFFLTCNISTLLIPFADGESKE